jgi:hypothetical protein
MLLGALWVLPLHHPCDLPVVSSSLLTLVVVLALLISGSLPLWRATALPALPMSADQCQPCSVRGSDHARRHDQQHQSIASDVASDR